eukprot:Awhi_evm1s14966
MEVLWKGGYTGSDLGRKSDGVFLLSGHLQFEICATVYVSRYSEDILNICFWAGFKKSNNHLPLRARDGINNGCTCGIKYMSMRDVERDMDSP